MPPAISAPGPSLWPDCGGLTAYKRHLETRTVSCAACRAAARTGEAQYRKQRYLYGPRKMSALGSQRRLQALHAIGWTAGEIGALMTPPVSDVAVQKIMKRDVIYRDKAARLARVYDQLWSRPGKSVKTRARAAAAGWLPPLAWDDERLDDPDYVPLERVLRDWDAALAEDKRRRSNLIKNAQKVRARQRQQLAERVNHSQTDQTTEAEAA